MRSLFGTAIWISAYVFVPILSLHLQGEKVVLDLWLAIIVIFWPVFFAMSFITFIFELFKC